MGLRVCYPLCLNLCKPVVPVCYLSMANQTAQLTVTVRESGAKQFATKH